MGNLDEKSDTDISITRSNFGEGVNFAESNQMKITTSRLTKEPLVTKEEGLLHFDLMIKKVATENR